MPLWGKLGDQLGRKRVLLARRGALHHRVDGLRAGADDERAAGRALRSGHRRRRARRGGHGRDGRHHPGQAARPLDGLSGRRLRGGQRARPGARRRVRPAAELAVGVLHQPARRHPGHHPHRHPAARSVPPPGALPGRSRSDPDHADAGRVHRPRQHRRHRLRLDLGGRAHLRRRRRGVRCRLHLPRGPGGRAGAAAAAVRRPGDPRQCRRQSDQRLARCSAGSTSSRSTCKRSTASPRRRPGWCSSPSCSALLSGRCSPGSGSSEAAGSSRGRSWAPCSRWPGWRCWRC